MRELNECKAEVYRRSEERIKERRRKRNRVFACGTPICLGIAVWAVMTLPQMVFDGKISIGSDDAAEVEIIDISDTFVQVEIQSGDQSVEYYEKIAKTDTVLDIYAAISEIFTTSDNNSNMENKELWESENIADASAAATEKEIYTITFAKKSGLETVFILESNALLDVDNNNTIYLSLEQLDELKTMLGFMEK